MLTTVWGTLITIGLALLPGALLGVVFSARLKKFTTLDAMVAVLLLSGVWNLLFFLVRMAPWMRVTLYVAGLVALVWMARRQWHQRRLALPSWRALAMPLFAFALGALLVGLPLHQLNESRLIPATGGDVEFFLYKTQLLRGGYSIFDDLYADQVNFYGTFIPAQVALGTMLEGRQLAPHAESFRVMTAVFIFFLIYAWGRAMRFRESESLLFAIFTLPLYHIWSHLEFYVMAGMAFYPTLIFFYFATRAFLEDRPPLWVLAGLAAGLVVHTHPVHTLVDGSLAILLMVAFAVVRWRQPFKKTLRSLGFFTAGATPAIVLYFAPLIVRYRLKTTSDFHLIEEFDNNLSAFVDGVLSNTLLWVSVAATVLVLISAGFRRAKKSDGASLFPAALWFFGLLGLYLGYKIYALLIHRLSIFIDAGDYMTLISALGWSLVVGLVFVGADAGLKRFGKISWGRVVRWAAVALVFLLMFPPSPLSRFTPSIFERYGMQLWSMTRLPKAEGDRAMEGILADPSFREFAEGLHEALPMNAAVLMTPNVTHTFGSFFERKMIYYDSYAHSTVFLDPDFYQRNNDVKAFYENPTDTGLANLINRYGVTHVLFTWRDIPETRRFFEQSTLLEESVSPNWRGVLFKVRDV